jgi:tRNA-splicing ligase RtcB
MHFGPDNVIDARSVAQLNACLTGEEGSRGALMADHHPGYSCPIGGVVAYREHVSPSAVGYDIACGNLAVRTVLDYEDVRGDIAKIMDEIFATVSFGMGRTNNEKVDHPVLDEIARSPFAPQRQLAGGAAAQLGTVGAGNHYVDLFNDETGKVWVGVHFGSRGFGHKTASGFLSMAQGGSFEEKGKEGEMDSPPVLIRLSSALGQDYVAAMTVAGNYAYAGREWVVEKIITDILGTRPSGKGASEWVHNHHNFAWRETHDGDVWWVHRKGATPAWPGQTGFVGASMEGTAVILRGVDSPASARALYSTVHGAGRVMSRTEAAGKVRKRWECLNYRNCAYTAPSRDHGREADGSNPRCPRCGGRMRRRFSRVGGAVDYAAVRSRVGAAIELRGGGADEAPECYKDLSGVLAAHAGTIEIVHRLTPIGVAMAGPEIDDPYKD